MQEIVCSTLLPAAQSTSPASGLLGERLTLLQQVYKHRCQVLCDSLTKHLGGLDGFDFTIPQGGYFVWVHLPATIVCARGLSSDWRLVIGNWRGLMTCFQDTTQLLALCTGSFGVAFSPGRLFSSVGLHANRMRLCFAHYDQQQIEQGVARLAKAIHQQLAG
jgi:2-aminoadipate transaminase